MFRLFSLFCLAFLAQAGLMSLQASDTNHPVTPLLSSTAATDSRTRSNKREELEKSVAALEQIYLNRSNSGLAYHPMALSNLKLLLDLSKTRLAHFGKKNRRPPNNGLFQQFGQKKMTMDELLNDQDTLQSESDFIDLLSAVLLHREAIYQKEAMAFAKLKNIPYIPDENHMGLPQIQPKSDVVSDKK